MDFTAIDFETATRRSDSACQLAAVRVRNGEIVDSACWLIRPRPFVFSPANIQIHGITPAMVRDEPEFGELWPQIQSTLGDDCLIAHNASFDLGVLLACLESHDHPAPEFQYSCTRAIARRTWPQQPRFGLKPLSDWLGIRFRHHDALEDSVACAKIALAAAEDKAASSLEDLESKLSLSRGAAGSWGKKGPTSRRSTRSRRRSASPGSPAPGSPAPRGSGKRTSVMIAGSTVASHPMQSPSPCGMGASGVDLQRLLVRADFIRPLEGRRVVFTGVLHRLQREEAEMLTSRCGGQCQSSVSRKTDLVVVGELDSRTIQAGRSMSTKEETARQLAEEGAPVRILSEQEFLEMIIAGESS
ncbi:exonuclease domain-containing protein [Rhodopirellula halodulae]|uniref:exonuclease domain-containing protein n=1 Tax=Rhodopirellula halodulae TaxID=2894198 RepID=UPI001E4F4C35|nr:exonuclease domain-containing protein [Rhodopirellula sp. JC737]MCC9655933.1 DNA polymerase III subunit epsilon [Rhodopirellula sp. JC737]